MLSETAEVRKNGQKERRAAFSGLPLSVLSVMIFLEGVGSPLPTPGGDSSLTHGRIAQSVRPIFLYAEDTASPWLRHYLF
jgi:hypothetical protein